MKILNISSSKYKIGKSVVCIKKYTNGLITIPVGRSGLIEGISIESFPDFNLFNIRILYFT